MTALMPEMPQAVGNPRLGAERQSAVHEYPEQSTPDRREDPDRPPTHNPPWRLPEVAQ